ncbi:porin, partial [Shewanella algidipiscicola]
PDFKASGDINIYNSQAQAAVAFDEINIPLPDIFQVAGFHQLTDKFALHYTAQLTTWGDFHELTVNDGTLGPVSVGSSSLKTYAWDDSWLFSVGGTYSLNNTWTLRAGFMADEGVVGELSSISIPDSDRKWYTAGATYALSTNTSIDFGIAVVRGEDVHLIENSSFTDELPIGPNTGLVNATTRSNATYYSMQYNYTF